MIAKLDRNIGRMTFSSVCTLLTILLYQVSKTCAVTEKKGIHFGKALRVNYPAFDKLHIYTTIPDISFAACVEQCKRRYVCGFVNYWNRVKMCYILRTSGPYVNGYEDHIVKRPGFVLGVKSEWQEPETPPCRPRFHITNTRKNWNLDNRGQMTPYNCNTLQYPDLPVDLNTPGTIQPGTCNGIDSVKAGHTSCYVMFWESQSGLGAYNGVKRQVNKVLAVDNGGIWGTWREAEYCPVGTYAVGYTVETERPQLFEDNTALNEVKLHCASVNDVSMRIVSNITSGREDDAEAFSNYMCTPEGGILFLLTSFKMKVQPQFENPYDETAASNIMFRCRDFNGTQPEQWATTQGLGVPGVYGNRSESCPPKSAICGLETKIMNIQGDFYDDTALNDVRVFCCRV